MARSKRDKIDPTGQAKNRAQSAKKLESRLTSAMRKITAMVAKLEPTRSTEQIITNEQKTVYRYSLTPQQLDDLVKLVRSILNAELLESQRDDMPPSWWWKSEIEPPYRRGAQQEFVQFNQQIAIAASLGFVNKFGVEPQRVPPEIALSSPAYAQGLNNAYVSNWQSIKSLSDTTASQVIRVINSGIQAGLSPSDVANQIVERFDVARSSARRIADTEINAAYNNARMNATRIAAEQSGLNAGVIHVSALLPVTRQTHADRHGNAYTVADQLAWWDSDANRINCYCSTRSVLLDDSGRVVSGRLQDELRSER